MGLPPEAPDVRFAREVFWEETEFKKRAHPVCQQGIDKIIDVLPIEYQGFRSAAGRRTCRREAGRGNADSEFHNSWMQVCRCSLHPARSPSFARPAAEQKFQ